MDRSHRPADDLEVVVYDFSNWRQAIRRARCIGNDVVLRRVVLILVDAQHDGYVFVGRRSCNNDLLHRATQMLLRQLSLSELPGGLDDDLRAHRFPIELRRVFLAKTRMFLPSTLIESAVAEILLGRLPRMESYFSRCASVFGSVRSLTATKSRL